jgi:thiosulfate/3-mercaptopyruvate sulfurtransferase
MKQVVFKRSSVIAAACLLLAAWAPAVSLAEAAASVPETSLIEPADLALLLQVPSAPKPLLLQVGFRKLYDQAHIPGSEYAGPASTPAGLQLLRERVAKLPRDSAIVIYCGCCPWVRCPNIAAALALLEELGFGKVKALHIADNFGADWVDHGYPTAKEP